MNNISRYRLLGDIMLSFIEGNDQRDYTVGPREGGTVECDGKTVWYVTPDGARRLESITTANIVDVALERGLLEEIK